MSVAVAGEKRIRVLMSPRLDGAKGGQLWVAGENCLIEGEFGLKQGRPILPSTWGMPLVLKEARDMRRALEAQRLGKGLNGSCWHDRVVEAVGQEDGPVDLVDVVDGRAALVTQKVVREWPDEAVQLVTLELVRPPAELE